MLLLYVFYKKNERKKKEKKTSRAGYQVTLIKSGWLGNLLLECIRGLC